MPARREGLFLRRAGGLNKVMLSRDLADRAGSRLSITARGGRIVVRADEGGRKIHNYGRGPAISDADTWSGLPDGRIVLAETAPGVFEGDL